MSILKDGREQLKDLMLQGEVGVSRVVDPLRHQSYLKLRSNALLRPTRIYGLLNDRCNERCITCTHWQQDTFDEISTADWIRALTELKELTGTYHINFSGGEPFLRKDIYEIFAHLRTLRVLFGVCTNGSAITEEGARRLCELHLFNYNTSLDGATAETHNVLRGTNRAWEWVMRGIARMQKAGKEVGYTPPIVVKPTVNRRNMREMPEIVRMAQEEGWSAVNFQPMGAWTEASMPGGELWIGPEDLPELRDIVEQLIAMKDQGYPVWTSTDSLRKMIYHFEQTEPPGRRSWCSVGMTNFTILANGDVVLCNHFPPVGNVTRQSVRDIWFAPSTETARQEMTYCTRLCLENCLVERSLKDQLHIISLLRNRLRRR